MLAMRSEKAKKMKAAKAGGYYKSGVSRERRDESEAAAAGGNGVICNESSWKWRHRKSAKSSFGGEENNINSWKLVKIEEMAWLIMK